MQARMRAAEFNACPMPRKHDFDVMSAVAPLDPHVVVRNGDDFAVVAAFEAAAQGPAEQQHFQPCKRQDRPEAPEGHEAGDSKGGQAQRAEENERPARAQGAVRNNLDSLLQATGHVGKSAPLVEGRDGTAGTCRKLQAQDVFYASDRDPREPRRLRRR